MNVPGTERTGNSTAPRAGRSVRVCSGLLLTLVFSGCAAFHPLQGIPASYVPDEYLGPSRSGKKTIDLSLLVQRPPDQYRLASGDILSVYVPGVLGSLRIAAGPGGVGDIGETPPINLPQSSDDPPTIGYPTAVRDDGTLSLPLVPPVNVHGLTLAEAEDAVRQAYTVHANILNNQRDRVLLSLARRREYRVLVVRQETSNELSAGSQPGTLNIGNSKKGTAKVVRLPAYENDVLHALAKAEGGSDGLPGLDAKNTIYIVRRKRFEYGGGVQPAPAFEVPQDAFVPPPTAASPNWGTAPAIDEPSWSARESVNREPAPPASSPQTTAVAPPPWPEAPPVPPESPLINPAPLPESGHRADTPAPEAPIWPRPAEPAESLRRTSAEGPAVWGHTSAPVVRGQSPAAAFPGHSGFGPSAASPYGQITRGLAPTVATPYQGMDPGGHDQSWQGYLTDFDPTIDNPNVTKIPIRLGKGDHPMFTERDIILQDGDIVFIESRETEVFYTGGLLGGGQYTLPRDYDLGVLEAISIAQSGQVSQNQATRNIGGISALNMDVTFSASHVVVLRKLVNGTRMPIEVDLYQALRHPERENILIQPGDMVILQYTKLEAIGAFLERHLLEGALFGIAAAQLNNNGGGF
ncbi:MAG: polysaccharide biosynthesis/export family protein [Planctomycetaceae bacterium]